MNQIYNVIIGTAGHIDHGKSSLVRKLTGIDPDRLPEEKERGMTIDLGFAPLVLKNGQKVGIIDVPGHERFIKNMVAGATGIDIVMLIIAADDGIMPQTREHLNIMTLLGIKRGLVVINKIDLVEKDILDIVKDDIAKLVNGTFLEDAPVVCVSAQTGEGIDGLKETLEKIVLATAPRDTGGIFRMPIQRVFSAKGFGTIVTGVPVAGSAKVGDTVEILPLGRRARIRGFQAYKSDVSEVKAGHSSAINVADIDYTTVKRGDVVATPDYFKASVFVEGRFRYLAEFKKPLKNSTPIRLHTGTSENVGRIALLDKSELKPGEDGFVQFRLDDPIVVSQGDVFIARIQSPMVTIGGGVVIGAANTKIKRLKGEIIENLAAKESALSNPVAFAELCAMEFGERIFDARALGIAAKLQLSSVNTVIADLKGEGKIITTPSGRFIHRESLEKALKKLQEILAKFHKENPLLVGVSETALRQSADFEEELFKMVLEKALAKGLIASENDRIRLAGFGVQLKGGDADMLLKIERIIKDAHFQTPRREEIYPEFKAQPAKIDKLLGVLEGEGKIVFLKDGVILHKEAVEKARELLLTEIKQKGSVESGNFKEMIGTTRKYAIPLLEFFDSIGLTVRKGNVRTLKNAGEFAKRQ